VTNAQGSRGWAAPLVGAILVALGAVQLARAQKFASLVELQSADGVTPLAGLVQGVDGNFYGTNSALGVNNGGAIFKVTPTGTLTTLYSFCAQPNCTDGDGPEASLVQGADGNLYGTTYGGGIQGPCYGQAFACGTVFKITPGGTLTTIYEFCSQANCTDGANPSGTLVQASDGNFYGTTYSGGYYDGQPHGCGDPGCGTVFKITPTGTLTTLYSFCAEKYCSDGYFPVAGLIQATDGNFYGTTPGGGETGYGTVFKITPKGTLTTLFSFCDNCTGEGYRPEAGLVQANDGNFYGTAEYGGNKYSYGTIFKITPSGTVTTLYSFNNIDGSGPIGGLIQSTDGDLYGTTSGGGTANGCVAYYGVNNCGTVFKITLTGTLTTLHSFCIQADCSDGAFPYAGLVQATNGNLYGTTFGGGTYSPCYYRGCGTVFAMNGGVGPFVETLLTSGKVGDAVRILGNSLEGTTSVTFSGTAATFKVVSDSLISTTVPAGATTGPVQVVTPSGTLTSNVNFQVIP
jgi:uncharacterized repeat protein (TIGR03803 family)